jgi:hypothetical protein
MSAPQPSQGTIKIKKGSGRSCHEVFPNHRQWPKGSKEGGTRWWGKGARGALHAPQSYLDTKGGKRRHLLMKTSGITCSSRMVGKRSGIGVRGKGRLAGVGVKGQVGGCEGGERV